MSPPALERAACCAAERSADGAGAPSLPDNRRSVRRVSAFTLAEVLAALLFMAIVIPVAVEAIHIASMSGEVAVRKAEATRIADRVLTEAVATTNWVQGGTVVENGHEYRWNLHNESWSASTAMQLMSADVQFSAQGRDYTVHLTTLANQQTPGSTMGAP